MTFVRGAECILYSDSDASTCLLLISLGISVWFEHGWLNYSKVRTCHCAAFSRLVQKSAAGRAGKAGGSAVGRDGKLNLHITLVDHTRTKLF